ncbi:hypothetical protein D3C72_2211980 [compost metagenome]
MGVFDIQREADVGQLLAAAAMEHMVEHQDVQRRQFGQPRAGHASHHPAVERMGRDDQAEFDFGQFWRGRGQMGRGNDGVPDGNRHV